MEKPLIPDGPTVLVQTQSPNAKVQTPKLNAALAKAQAKIFNPGKNRTVDVKNKDGNHSYSYDYAELNVVTEIIRLPLSDNELTFTQSIDFKSKQIVTVLMHSSGEEREYFYPLLTTERQGMKNEQVLASGFTYGKRQALKGIFGIADDTEDKDGHDGDQNVQIQNKQKTSAKANAAGKAPPPPIPKGEGKALPPPVPKGSEEKKPSLTGPASPELLQEIENLSDQKSILAGDLSALVLNGYAWKGERLPTWIALELIDLLKRDDVTQGMIMDQIQKVKERREMKAAAAKVKK